MHRENLKFSPDDLSQNVLRALQSNNLIDPSSHNRVEIVVKEIRVRSNFSAVMWGFMAGSDHITGEVNIKDATDKTLNSFEVSASYALGGLADWRTARMTPAWVGSMKNLRNWPRRKLPAPQSTEYTSQSETEGRAFG